MTNQVAWVRGVCAGLRAIPCQHVVYVPDNPLSQLLAGIAANCPGIQTTLVTREEEAVGVAAGLHLAGVRPAILMQSSGIGNAVNALASLLVPYQLPVLMVVSMRGDPGEWNWAQVPMGRAVPRILEALGIQYLTVEHAEAAEEAVRAGGALAFGTGHPAAVLLPRRLTVPVGGR
jgi:sulfopyruvate decarboxylase subunit alpha